ncbi:MAG: hypothetical protein AB7P08_10340 [Burkholderiales bacterium]
MPNGCRRARGGAERCANRESNNFVKKVPNEIELEIRLDKLFEILGNPGDSLDRRAGMVDSSPPCKYHVSIELQRIFHDSDDPWEVGLPSIDREHSVVIGVYQDEPAARARIEAILSVLGAKARWSDVRPTEECALCEIDFRTEERHVAIVLERRAPCGSPGDDESYPARLCPDCTSKVVPKLDTVWRTGH